MKKIEVREGHLPEKIKHLVLNPMVKKGIDKPIEVWECNSPTELMEYVEERNASYQPLQPFKDKESGKEDSHWYVCAILVSELTETGIEIPCNKLLFAAATPEYLRSEGAKVAEQKKAEADMRKRWMPH